METWIAVGSKGRGRVLIHRDYKYQLNKKNSNHHVLALLAKNV